MGLASTDPAQAQQTRKAAILDSQSVKSDPHGGAVGDDAAERIKGRKRHLLVDTLGLLLGIEITPASTPERDGARTLLKEVLQGCSWLQLMGMAESGKLYANLVVMGPA